MSIKKSIAALVSKSGIQFQKKKKQFDLEVKPKKVRRMVLNDAAKTEAMERVASGAIVPVVTEELGIGTSSVQRLKNARIRTRIGETDGATILRRSLLENAIIAGEVVRDKVEDLDARNAAVVMGISTSNYLAMRKETEGEQITVSPRDIAVVADKLMRLKQIADSSV